MNHRLRWMIAEYNDRLLQLRDQYKSMINWNDNQYDHSTKMMVNKYERHTNKKYCSKYLFHINMKNKHEKQI